MHFSRYKLPGEMFLNSWPHQNVTQLIFQPLDALVPLEQIGHILSDNHTPKSVNGWKNVLQPLF